MVKYKLSIAELNSHLNEQIGALQRSAELFDAGYELEARRMAVTLRVLLHSGRHRHPSLLKQLGRDDMEFVDSALPYNPDNLMTFHGLISMMIGVETTSYEAKLDLDLPFTRKPFSSWWAATVFADTQKQTMSRADVVKTAADQDGGAHVDASLRADYAALRHENSLGWRTNNGQPPKRDPAYAAVRQITHEVLKTLIPGYKKTTEDVQRSRKKAEISGGKMRFFPHEEQFYINETARPIVPGKVYDVEIMVDTITTGSVMMVVNTAASDPVISAGKHRMRVVAGPDQFTGVFGHYTDAIVDHVGIKDTGEIGDFNKDSPRLIKR